MVNGKWCMVNGKWKFKIENGKIEKGKKMEKIVKNKLTGTVPRPLPYLARVVVPRMLRSDLNSIGRGSVLCLWQLRNRVTLSTDKPKCTLFHWPSSQSTLEKTNTWPRESGKNSNVCFLGWKESENCDCPFSSWTSISVQESSWLGRFRKEQAKENWSGRPFGKILAVGAVKSALRDKR